MNHKEEIIREQRMIEATRKRYTGSTGKFGVIVTNMGEPIYVQGSLNFNQTFMEDPWSLSDPDELPVMDEEDTSYRIGWFFEGLKIGTNIEIKYLDHKSELTVRYNGKIVYCEISSELERYAPDEEWESQIELLYEAAMKRQNKRKKQYKLHREEMIEQKRKEILDELKDKWGL